MYIFNHLWCIISVHVTPLEKVLIGIISMRAMISTSSSASSLPQVPVPVDSKGRVRTSAEQKRLILAEFERSGVSVVQFAKRAGL